MTVLLTGGNGFIGRHCIPKLLDRGYDVCAVSSQARRASDVDWRQVDLLDAGAMRAVIASVRPTHLLHMAWVTTPGAYWTSNENLQWLAASLQLLEEFRHAGGARVVAAGTCAEYDWSSGVCSEATTPLRPATLYGTCKHALQEVLQAFGRQNGLSSAWGRVFFTYGPHEHPARLVPSVVGRLLTGTPVPCTDGRQRRDFLFVEDVADAFVCLLASKVSGAVNIASGIPVTVHDLVRGIASRLDGEALLRFGARPAAPGDPDTLSADVTRLRDELGWTPQYSLGRGLDVTIDWWRQQVASGLISPAVFC